jgi:septal ring factor EnvC (AmiA/AmiB activator)
MSVPYLKELNNLSTDAINAGQSLMVNSALSELIDPRSFGKQGDTTLVWPVKATSVTYMTGKISGVQLTAKKDETVMSISSGTVMFSELYRGYGQVVFVQNSAGYVYGYASLASVSVQKGDKVFQGSMLGKAGVDALNGKSQILFMTFKNGKPTDPASAPRG